MDTDEGSCRLRLRFRTELESGSPIRSALQTRSSELVVTAQSSRRNAQETQRGGAASKSGKDRNIEDRKMEVGISSCLQYSCLYVFVLRPREFPRSLRRIWSIAVQEEARLLDL